MWTALTPTSVPGPPPDAARRDEFGDRPVPGKARLNESRDLATCGGRLLRTGRTGRVTSRRQSTPITPSQTRWLGVSAPAQEELARWFVEQHRAYDAQPLIDAARATYTDIGATGWLARLDAWDIRRHPTVASSNTTR